MDLSKASLVICITLFLVVGLNAVIYVSVTRKRSNNTVGQIELMRRAARRARNPWEDEDRDLAELSRRVAGLRPQEPPDPDRTSE